MAQRSYKISSISVQLFSLYQITTDKHQLWSGRIELS
jgi:hypothetical protein